MLKVLELFGGIGACTKALERLGIEHEVVDYVEIDKYAVKSFNAIHNTNFEPQDICEWDKNIDVDLIMHGSPCQDFSLSGKQAGGDEGSGTRSSLMYETIRIVKKLKPKYVVWENVKNVLSKKHKHNFEAYITQLRLLGYYSYYQVLNAKDFGIPQNRERVFVVSIRSDVNTYGCHVFNYSFPEKQELKLKLKDMLEDKVDKKYYLDENKVNQITLNNPIKQNEYMPKVVAGVGKKDSNSNTQWKQQNRIYDDNISPTIATMFFPYYAIKNNTKKGYQEAFEGDGIDLTQPNSQTRRGRVQKNSIQTLTTQNNLGVCVIGNYMPSGHEVSRIVDNKGIAPTIKENHGTVNTTQTKDLRIRKLTPKECWRLMGFDDEDYDKASKVCSNSQLYKQAGNSIVVNVLENILKNLLK